MESKGTKESAEKPAVSEVRRSLIVKTSPALLFEALTDAERLRMWLCEKAAIDQKAGGKVRLQWKSEAKAEGKVAEIVPGERLALALEWSDRKGSARLDSSVEFRVRAEGDGTRVTLTQLGFDGDDARRKAFERGWAHHLERLRSLFEDGRSRLLETEEMATIPVTSESPYGVAWDGTHLWHTDAGSGKLVKLDPSSGKTLAEFSLGGAPTGIDWDGSSLWVLDAKRRAALHVDPETGEVRRRLKILRVAGDLTDLAWDGNNLWVGMTGEGGKIVRLEPRTGMAQGSNPSPDGSSGIAFDRDSGAHFWVAALRPRILHRIEAKKGAAGERFGLRGEPAGLAWDGQCLWHTDLEARALVRVQPIRES
jgi:uncharacterized protein YndB with AHSA1/START domain